MNDRDVQYLMDVDRIKRLKASYCKLADSLEDADAFADLFTPTAELDEGEDGVFVGRESIRSMYAEVAGILKLNQHLVFSPLIEVQGDRASGEWRLLQLSTVIHPEGDRAFLACGNYRERYLKCEGNWLFEQVEARVHFCTPYEDGWVKTPFGEFFPGTGSANFTSASVD